MSSEKIEQHWKVNVVNDNPTFPFLVIDNWYSPNEEKAVWKELDFFNNYHNVKWYWVKAHDGNFGNEKADMLANKAIDLKISNM